MPPQRPANPQTRRNLFQYADQPHPTKRALVAPVHPSPPNPPQSTSTPPTPPITFPTRYIGLATNPIAVFLGDDVVTAHVGETIATKFTIREISAQGVLVQVGEELLRVPLQ